MASATQSSAGQAAGAPPFTANDSRRAGAGAGLETGGRFLRAARLTRGMASGGDDWAWAKILGESLGRRGPPGPETERRRDWRSRRLTPGERERTRHVHPRMTPVGSWRQPLPWAAESPHDLQL